MGSRVWSRPAPNTPPNVATAYHARWERFCKSPAGARLQATRHGLPIFKERDTVRPSVVRCLRCIAASVCLGGNLDTVRPSFVRCTR